MAKILKKNWERSGKNYDNINFSIEKSLKKLILQKIWNDDDWKLTQLGYDNNIKIISKKF